MYEDFVNQIYHLLSHDLFPGTVAFHKRYSIYLLILIFLPEETLMSLYIGLPNYTGPAKFFISFIQAY